MLNVIKNSIFTYIFLFLCLTSAAIFAMGDLMIDEIKDVITNLGMPQPVDSVWNFYDNVKEVALPAIRIYIYFVIAILLISSFISPTSFVGYILGAFSSVITSIFILYTSSIMWNMMIGNISTYLDILAYSDDILFFAQFYAEIVVANLIAGLVSFVWSNPGARRGFGV